MKDRPHTSCLSDCINRNLKVMTTRHILSSDGAQSEFSSCSHAPDATSFLGMR
jgi:hypothetical protein